MYRVSLWRQNKRAHERRRVDGGRKRTNAGSENQERARREPGTSGGAKMDQERLKGAQQQR